MRISPAIKLTALFAALFTLTFGPAYAGHGRRPCRQDIQALCPTVTPGPGAFRECLGTLCPNNPPGPGALVNCLEQYADKLSPACQEHLARTQAKITAWKQACQADVQQLCGDVLPGHGNIIRCLRQNHDQLSQPCADLLSRHHRHHNDHHDEPAPTAE